MDIIPTWIQLSVEIAKDLLIAPSCYEQKATLKRTKINRTFFLGGGVTILVQNRRLEFFNQQIRSMKELVWLMSDKKTVGR